MLATRQGLERSHDKVFRERRCREAQGPPTATAAALATAVQQIFPIKDAARVGCKKKERNNKKKFVIK